jgi:hypothetical protein
MFCSGQCVTEKSGSFDEPRSSVELEVWYNPLNLQLENVQLFRVQNSATLVYALN